MSGFSQKRLCYPVLSAEALIFKLPTEALLHIFSYLDSKDLVACIQTCKCWREVIEESETLWKLQCLTLKDSEHHISEDRNRGLTWKEAFQQNYGSNGIKKLWRLGTFSNPSCYKDLPTNPFCMLDAESWGEIFQGELQRT